MKVEKVRIQNFQCIRDSGDIPIDDRVTVLVGENESGKSAILKALLHFNQNQAFKDVDISTMSFIRPRLDSGELSKGSVEMVAIWVTLSDKEKRVLALPNQLGHLSEFKIVKTLDNQYKVFTGDGKELADLIAGEGLERLVTYLNDLRRKVQDVYCGQVKRKEAVDEFVFLQRQEGEDADKNLILFCQRADHIWYNLGKGDWVQVTKIAEDPFGRNRRALNAGLKFDLQPLILEFIDSVQSKKKTAMNALQIFEDKMGALPMDHPLRDYIGDNVLSQLKDLCEVPIGEDQIRRIGQQILSHVPSFVYLPSVEDMSDSISLYKLSLGGLEESESLLVTLLEIAGLKPGAAVEKEHGERMKILREKSEIVSERLQRHWFKRDIKFEFDFHKQDSEIGAAVDSDGSLDPPSRRSQGFCSYVSLFAKLAQLAAKENVLVLLDDPAVHLHPVAQRKILALLEAQPYQIVLATHLPFMIDPQHLERIRVIKRSPAGSQVEQDWDKAQESLLPVWGCLVGGFSGKICLLVEGPTDREFYTAASKACRDSGREHLDDDTVVIPAGGSQLPYVGQALHSRGILFVAIVDGDEAGQNIKKHTAKLCDVDPRRIVVLSEMGLSTANPTVEDLFSPEFNAHLTHGDLRLALGDIKEGRRTFDEQTLSSFEKVFSSIRKALPKIESGEHV